MAAIGSQENSSLPATGRAVLAVVAGAATWGCIWYPYRLLAQGGLDGVWALLLTELVAIVATGLWFYRPLRADFHWTHSLFAIGLLSGICNVAFVMGTLLGEVIRVTLLMYMAPLWTVLLSRWILQERLWPGGWGLIVMALSGAIIMLWHPAHGAPWPASLADWLGIVAGMTFAAYNVMVKKATQHGLPEKSLSSLVGTLLVGLACLPFAGPLPVSMPPVSIGVVVLTGLALFVMIPMVQYGLMRLPANRASVIMLSELIFAGASAWWLAGEVIGAKEWLGGGLIVVAGALAARPKNRYRSSA